MCKRVPALLLAALLVVSASPKALAEQALLLACSVAPVDSDPEQFSDVLCEIAAEQVRAASGRTVERVARMALPEQSGSAWLRLDLVIKGPNAVSAQAVWGGGGTEPGQSELFEAGIDDSTLNKATAELLARAMIGASPFSGNQ